MPQCKASSRKKTSSMSGICPNVDNVASEDPSLIRGTSHILKSFPAIISPEHLTSGILLHRPFHLDISHPEFFPASFHPDISHPDSLPPPSFHPDTSHPEFFPIAHSTRTYHIRNSSPPTFHPDISQQPFCSASILPYPDVSHPEFLSADIPPGRKFSLIPPGYSQPPFCPASIPPYPDVSHPEFFLADIPPGYLPSKILLRRHSIRISHIRNSVRPTFNPLRISHIRNSVRPTFHLFLHP
uniref:Uncharacterized protein n=1 Tax=Vitis vinifera TaxID=29760 RepID=A5BLH4_VITVI|nr:hypothetical protein VITISV_034482 [Vitis vinifera]